MEQEQLVSFASADEKIYEISKTHLGYSDLLNGIFRNADKTGATKVQCLHGTALLLQDKSSVLDVIFEYLTTGIADKFTEEFFSIFGLYGIPLPLFAESYDTEFVKIQLEETWQRKFTLSNPKCTYYELSSVVDQIQLGLHVNPNNVIHASDRIFRLNQLFTLPKKRFRVGGVDLGEFKGKLVVAGGSLVCNLLELPVNDYDFFFINTSFAEASEIMKKVLKQVSSDDSRSFSISAGKNCWTISINGQKLQFIFRNYKNIDEIMLGFDIDACSIVYDGKSVKLSKRCLYALKNHVNNVDFTRLSPTYEYRLAKYHRRGFDIFVPMIDFTKMKKKVSIPKAIGKMYINRTTGVLTLMSAEGRRVRIPSFRSWKSSLRRSNRNPSVVPAIPSDPSHPYSKYKNSSANEQYNRQVCGRKGTDLTGLDALLYLCNKAQLANIAVSDYAREKIDYDRYIVLNNRSYSDDVCLRPGKFMNFHLKISQIDQLDSSDLTTDLAYYDLSPEWITENAGHQITSSIHALALENPGNWYNGFYYDDPSLNNTATANKEEESEEEDCGELIDI